MISRDLWEPGRCGLIAIAALGRVRPGRQVLVQRPPPLGPRCRQQSLALVSRPWRSSLPPKMARTCSTGRQRVARDVFDLRLGIDVRHVASAREARALLGISCRNIGLCAPGAAGWGGNMLGTMLGTIPFTLVFVASFSQMGGPPRATHAPTFPATAAQQHFCHRPLCNRCVKELRQSGHCRLPNTKRATATIFQRCRRGSRGSRTS